MRFTPLLILLLGCSSPPIRVAAPPDLDRCNVVWTSASRDASGSMPIGNGELGANVWAEPDGDLVFYLSRTDAWSENARLLKLGRIRVSLAPNPFLAGFRQELKLREGRIEITAGPLTLQFFVDADHPVVNIAAQSREPVDVSVILESWRTKKHVLKGGELESSWAMHHAPMEVWESADSVVDTPGAVTWYHRNEHSIVDLTLAHQGLASVRKECRDPLLHRTFGGRITAPGFTKESDTILRSGPTTRFDIKVATHCAQTETADAWLAAMASAPALDAMATTAAWWGEFWSRSWIFVDGDSARPVPTNAHPLRVGVDSNGQSRFGGELQETTADLTNGLSLSAMIKPSAGEKGRIFDKITAGGSDGFLFDTHPGLALRFIVGDRTLVAERVLKAGELQRVGATYDPATGAMRILLDGKVIKEQTPLSITQAYVLQRWITACGDRGAYPIKFNGSIFTVDPTFTGGPNLNPDWRRWGGDFWWQNTRLPYAPMPARGDFNEMLPLFRFYANAAPLCRARAKLYHGVEGVYFPETMTIFGTYSNGDYGWDRKGHQPNEVLCPWWQYAWQQGLELVMLMFDYYDYTDDENFYRTELLPMARDVLRYYESRFLKDGRFVIKPTQAVETYWHDVVNDTPSVAGLRAVVDRLLKHTGGDEFKRLDAAIPELTHGLKPIRPAESYKDQRSNCENPELYAIWPFRVVTGANGGAGSAISEETFRRRIEKGMVGWSYDGQCAALCGLTDEAKKQLLAKVANGNPNHRFPVMWGPNFDWLPDQDHGANLMLTLQLMILQCDGDDIAVLPAWPKEWNVSFKLRAPHNTVVEGLYRNGRLERLDVTPASRRKDSRLVR